MASASFFSSSDDSDGGLAPADAARPGPELAEQREQAQRQAAPRPQPQPQQRARLREAPPRQPPQAAARRPSQSQSVQEPRRLSYSLMGDSEDDATPCEQTELQLQLAASRSEADRLEGRARDAVQRIEELEVQIEENEVRWSHRQRSSMSQWVDERERLERELHEQAPMQLEDDRAAVQRVVLAQVSRLHDALSTQRGELVFYSRQLAEENRRLEERAERQAVALERREAESAGARLEALQLRDVGEAEEARAARALGRAECLEEEARALRQGGGERLDRHLAERLLSTERADRLRLEGLRRGLESELQAALAAGRDSARRQAEGAHARLRLLEAELRARTRAEVAEARQAVAELRAEAAEEEAQRLGAAPEAAGCGEAAELLAERRRSQALERALASREEELRAMRQQLATAEADRAEARQAASGLAEAFGAAQRAQLEGGLLRRAVHDAELERRQLLSGCSCLEERASTLEAQLRQVHVDAAWLEEICREDARTARWAAAEDVAVGARVEVCGGRDVGLRGRAWRGPDAAGNILILADGGIDLHLVASSQCRVLDAPRQGEDVQKPAPSDAEVLGSGAALGEAMLRLRQDGSGLVRRVAVLGKLMAGIERLCWEQGRLPYDPHAGCHCGASSAETSASAAPSSPRRQEEAQGGAEAVAALLEQVRSLGAPRSPDVPGGDGAGSPPPEASALELRAVRALERQAGLLERANPDWGAPLPVGAPPAPPGDDEDGLTPAERGAVLRSALERAAGRLEKLHARLQLLSPGAAAPP